MLCPFNMFYRLRAYTNSKQEISLFCMKENFPRNRKCAIKLNVLINFAGPVKVSN